MSSEKESKLLKHSFGVSLATFASRILGLFRVRLEAFALGGGTDASIWALTLAVPNLLRRLLGEGALGTALIPLIAETERDNGISAGRRALAQVLTVLGALLAAIVALFSFLAYFCGKSHLWFDWAFLHSERFLGICELLPLILPYTFFICLTGVIGAVLNYSNIFVRPALTALFFNICMIGGLAAGVVFKLPSYQLLTLLAVLTPSAGAIQLLLMLWMLHSCGRIPLFSREIFKSFSFTAQLFKIAAPGILGYGMLQLSFLIDRLLALYLGDQAVPALTYVDRVIDLPIGLFAVSLGSVLMASMTHAAAAADWEAVQKQLNFSMRHVWFITAPMAAGVIFFNQEILGVLCLGGRYTVSDLEAARYVAVFYGMGIPFFCSLKIILPAFYSRKDMKRPFYVSMISISVNIILNLILMFHLKQAGLALATVIASIVNNTLLLYLLARDGFFLQKQTFFSAFRSIAFALAAALPVFFCRSWLIRSFEQGFLSRCIILAVIGVLFICIFVALAAVCRTPELREFADILRRKRKKSTAK